MKVVILTEGGKNIGFGHITRCTALYQVFEERNILPTFIVNGDSSIMRLLKGKRYKIFDWLKERNRLFRQISGAEIVIVDSYFADISLYKKLSASVRIPVYMDDNKRLNYPRGIIVNATIYAEKMNYPRRKDSVYLLGSRYTPLRKEFWRVPGKKIREKVKDILITFGGMNRAVFTANILKYLLRSLPGFKYCVVLARKELNAQLQKLLKNKNIYLHYDINASDMVKLMLNCDIAISGGGQTLYELARVGVPTIAVKAVDNQINNVKGLDRAGFLKDAGCFKDSRIYENIISAIEKLQEKKVRVVKSGIGSAIVDGKGALRVAKYCIKKRYEQKIIFRKAEIKDMDNIYELSNEAEVRKNSYNSEKIELQTHKKWFLDKLNDRNCLFLVAEMDELFLGQVRFDIRKEEALVSISIVREYRDIGLGDLILEKSMGILRTEKHAVTGVRAYVKERNMNSAKLFEKKGFKLVNNIKIKGQDSFDYFYRFTNS